MGMPVRRFDDGAPQPKRRRGPGRNLSDAHDSDATDSAPEEMSVSQMLARVEAVRRVPARRRVLHLVRSGTVSSREREPVRVRRRWYVASSGGRATPHDLAARRGSGAGAGVDFAAVAEVAAHYGAEARGPPSPGEPPRPTPRGALHLCKARRDEPNESVTGLCVVYVDDAGAEADVARWWTIGSWSVNGSLSGQAVLQVLMDVLHESASIPACRITKLVLCDDLHRSDGVRAGIYMLKREELPSSQESLSSASRTQHGMQALHAMAAENSEISPSHMYGDENNRTVTAPASDAEIDAAIEGKFAHPVTGDSVDIRVE